MDTYRPLFLDSGHKLNQALKSGFHPCSLISTYKGLSLSQPVHIRKAGPEKLDVTISHHPEWISPGAVVALDHETFAAPLLGRVAGVDWHTLTAILTGIEEGDHPWMLREDCRVQPPDTIRIDLVAGRKHATGSLTNISMGGMGLLLNHVTVNHLHLEPGVPISLDLLLPDCPEKFELKGTVSRTTSIKRLPIYNVGIAVQPTPKQKELLQRYIQDRRRIILDELSCQLTPAFQPVTTKDLFF